MTIYTYKFLKVYNFGALRFTCTAKIQRLTWIVEKKVGIFIHYLTPSGKFQPGLEKANKFVSWEMAKTMAKVHGGVVRQLNKSE